MKILFLDCFSGISGDMTVGALCDLGVKPSALEWELSKLEIGDFHMHFDRAQRQQVEGVKFSIHEGATHTAEHDGHECCGHDHDHDQGHVHHHPHHEHGEHCCGHEHSHEEHAAEAHAHHSHHAEEEGHGHEHHEHEHGHQHEHEHAGLPEHDHEHGDEVAHAHRHHHEAGAHDAAVHGHHHHSHDHDHEHAHGRSYKEIKGLIEHSELSPFVKAHALGIFRRIAEAEGKIHGVPVEDVGFHEVGALDSIADIICACVGIEALGVEKVYVSPLHEGRGWVECAHGQFPVPAPATLEILKGIPLGQIDEPYELITPTGAAILAEFGQGFGLMPRMVAEKIGYGIGTRELASRPNVLRAVLGELAEA